jgi:hypothetical protein
LSGIEAAWESKLLSDLSPSTSRATVQSVADGSFSQLWAGSYQFCVQPPFGEDAGSDLAAALREQLGLVMERQNVTISNFAIDCAQRPSAN